MPFFVCSMRECARWKPNYIVLPDLKHSCEPLRTRSINPSNWITWNKYQLFCVNHEPYHQTIITIIFFTLLMSSNNGSHYLDPLSVSRDGTSVSHQIFDQLKISYKLRAKSLIDQIFDLSNNCYLHGVCAISIIDQIILRNTGWHKPGLAPLSRAPVSRWVLKRR